VFKALGVLLQVFAAFMIIPVLASLIWDDGTPTSTIPGLPTFSFRITTASFVLTATAVALLGLAMTSLSAASLEDLRERESLFVVGVAWLICGAIGGLPFLLTDATQDPSIAFFESMSGITTTGFSALALPLEQYPPSIHVWRAGLHFAGGVGLVVVAVALISRFTGGARRLIVGESGGSPVQLTTRLSRTAKLLFGVFVALNAVFFIAFWLAIHYTGLRLDWKTSAFHAIVHAFAGVGTGGYSSLTDSVAGFQSTTVSIVAIASMAAGAFSFPLYVQMWRGDFRTVFRLGEVRFYIALLVLPSAWAAVSIFMAGGNAGSAALHGAFMPISALTGTGFTSMNPQTLAADVRLLIILLMVTGGMVGSTSGALKIGRILLIFRMVAAEMRRLLHPHAVSPVRAGGRIMSEDEIRRVSAFFLAYIATLLAGAGFFALGGFDVESALVASAASLGNVGYGWGGVLLGFVDPMPAWTRYGGIALMWFGRLEIFAALFLLLPGTYRE
jgi:trk system potassium uptake protein